MRPVFASDIYALGVTCIYLMTGKSPKDIEYNPQTGAMMWQKHVQLGKHTTYVLSKMLEVAVKDRYQTADQVIEALANESVADLRSSASPAARPASSPSRPATLRAVGAPPAPPPPAQPANPMAESAMKSSSQRMAETIRAQRMLKDPTNIKNGEMTKSGLNTSFGATPSAMPSVRREPLKMDAPAVLSAFKRGQRTFNEIDLSTIDLPKAHLPGITLVKANCAQINFQGANLAAGKFESADFSDSVLRDAILSRSYFNHANLKNTDLRGADLSDAHLNYADLQGANLCGANLKGAKVTEEQLALAKTNFMTVFPNGKRGGFW
jgi:serine/threonine protein kinase, bacterial